MCFPGFFQFGIPTFAPLEAQNVMKKFSEKITIFIANFAGSSANVCEMSVKIVVFLADIDENVSQFHRIRRNFVKNIQPAVIC